MRNVTIIFAMVLAGIIFCCQFAIATKDCRILQILIGEKISYEDYLSTIANVGVFSSTLFATLYAIIQYSNHKREHRITLLGEYNQRYATDKNIQKVITWMLKIAILDEKGDIVDAEPSRFDIKPDINEKEMFMRFFEELYLHIENGSIDKRQACLLFSYYAIKFDEVREYRLDITDYKSRKELDEMNNEEKEKNNNLYWFNFQNYVDEMREEWGIISKMK